MNDLDLEPLIDEAWRMFSASQDACVVRPSIPILFFGDSQRYQVSPLKVITVGLNPSRREFPSAAPFERFPLAEGIDPGNLNDAGRTAYLAALDDYFRHRPYTSWFSWFEAVLRGMGASYYDGQQNTALHTDFCSPLATDPTWSGLGAESDRLLGDGKALWHKLVEQLAPDVIVISIRRHYRDQITYSNPSGWQPLVEIPRDDRAKRPYRAWAQSAMLTRGKPTLLVFGQAAQQPFATLTVQARHQVGQAARDWHDAG